jgi:hypothetical protein
MKTALFIALAICGAFFLAVWVQALFKNRSIGASTSEKSTPSIIELLIGFATNFFDTLGIGSFATTSAILKLKSLIADEDLPGTLNFYCHRAS